MNRLYALLKRELKTDQKDLTTYALVIVLVLFGFETMQSILARSMGTSFPAEVYGELFSSFLLVGGFILTSLIFSEDMFSKDHQHYLLLLQATKFEKFLYKELLVTIGYPVALTLLFFLTSVVTEPIQLIIFGNPMRLFNPFADSEFISLLGQFWVWNSIFLLGATYFRKAHFIKTVLAIGVIGLVLGLLALLFTKIVFSIRFGSSIEMFDAFFYLNPIQSSSTRGFVALSKSLYYVVLPLFCMVTAFYRVEEVQATDAV